MEATEANVQMPTFPLPEENQPDPAEAPVQPQNAAWFYNESSQMAIFGPPNSEGLLTIACDEDGALTVTRHIPASEGQTAVLTLASRGQTASLIMQATEMELGSGFVWQGQVPSDQESFRQLFLADEGEVTLSIGQGRPLQVPTSAAPVQAIDACS